MESYSTVEQDKLAGTVIIICRGSTDGIVFGLLSTNYDKGNASLTFIG